MTGKRSEEGFKNLRGDNIKKLILGMMVVAAIGMGGCVDTQEKTPTPTPEVRSTIIIDGVSIEFDKEVELLVRAYGCGVFGGHREECEESAKTYIDEYLHSHGVVIVEMYRGSLIYHEPSYGYFWLPDFEEDYKDMSIINEKYPRDEDFLVVPQKFNGENAMIILGDESDDPYWICCFNNLEDIRNFLRHIYSYEEGI